MFTDTRHYKGIKTFGNFILFALGYKTLRACVSSLVKHHTITYLSSKQFKILSKFTLWSAETKFSFTEWVKRFEAQRKVQLDISPSMYGIYMYSIEVFTGIYQVQ